MLTMIVHVLDLLSAVLVCISRCLNLALIHSNVHGATDGVLFPGVEPALLVVPNPNAGVLLLLAGVLTLPTGALPLPAGTLVSAAACAPGVSNIPGTVLPVSPESTLSPGIELTLSEAVLYDASESRRRRCAGNGAGGSPDTGVVSGVDDDDPVAREGAEEGELLRWLRPTVDIRYDWDTERGAKIIRPEELLQNGKP